MSEDTLQTSLILDVFKIKQTSNGYDNLVQNDHSFLFSVIIGNTIDDMTFPITDMLPNLLSDRGQFTDRLRSRIVPTINRITLLNRIKFD